MQVEGQAGRGAALHRRGAAPATRGALRRLDDLVQGQILGESVVRVKLWRAGRDDPLLRRAAAHRASASRSEPRRRELFETGGADAELSDLASPENRYERQEGKLLEAHTPIRTPDGTPVLGEVCTKTDQVYE